MVTWLPKSSVISFCAFRFVLILPRDCKKYFSTKKNKLANSLWESCLGNQGSFTHHFKVNVYFDVYNYHNSLQCLVKGIVYVTANCPEL